MQHTHTGQKKWIIAGVILVAILPFFCLVPYLYLLGFDRSDPEVQSASFLISRFLLWLLLAGIFLYARKTEQSSLLIWPEQRYSAGMYIAFFLLTFVALIVLLVVVSSVLRQFHLESRSEAWNEISGQFSRSTALLVFTCITAGVVEELLYRGYLQPRLELLFGNKIAGIAGSALLFGLLHFGFGTIQNIVGPFVIGLAFAIHYSRFRNIKFLIVFHVVWDLLAVFMLLYLKQEQA